MNFSTPQKVLETIRAGDEVEKNRATNRALINKAANNDPLLPDDDADKDNMQINIRWGEHMLAMANARRQYANNFSSQEKYFNVSIPLAPEEERANIEWCITETINDIMKNGNHAQEYTELDNSRWAGVVLHGVGAVLWENKYSWIPRFIPIEDLRIPTDTELSFRNLSWFAVLIPYTPYELARKAYGPETTFKWDKKQVSDILSKIKEVNTVLATNNYSWDLQPEKMVELMKQDGGYFSGDAMPTIPCWHFYHEDEDGNWYLKVVPRDESGTKPDTFLGKSESPVADSWQKIIHCQFGDLTSKPPFMYHAVRSLGMALYEPCFYSDLTRCKMLQHTIDQFNIWLRASDPVDRARAQIQVFQNLAVLKPGISVIPPNERHQVNPNLVESVMGQLKQLQSEASSSYTQQINDGTSREQTAFETGVKVQQVNSMLSGLMSKAFISQKFFYREVCRRFCLTNSDDKDVKEFQERVEALGVKEGWLNIKKWRIDPIAPLGNGNTTMAMVEAQNALQLRPMLDPESQQEALHDAAVQMVGARRANRWVKRPKQSVSNSDEYAMNMFSVLMEGVNVPIKRGVNPIEIIEDLLQMLNSKIQTISTTTQTPSAQEQVGMMTVSKTVAGLIQAMSQDQSNLQRIKAFAKQLGQIENQLKSFGANIKQSNNGGDDNGAMAKAQATMIQANAKLQAKQQADVQKLRMNEAEFKMDQNRKDAEVAANIQRQNVQQMMQPTKQTE